MRWQNSKQLHAHSADAAVQSFFAALKSWRKLRKSDPKARPPRRFGKYTKVQWKASAIRLRHGNLVLANGKGNEPLIVSDWKHGLPALVEMGWDGKQYELRCIYKSEAPAKIEDCRRLGGRCGPRRDSFSDGRGWKGCDHR